jgi:hypothetical protein
VAETLPEEATTLSIDSDAEVTLLANCEPEICTESKSGQDRKPSSLWKKGIGIGHVIGLLVGSICWRMCRTGDGGKQPVEQVEEAPAPPPATGTQKWTAEYDRFLKKAENYCKQGNYQKAKNAYLQALSVIPASDKSGKKAHVEEKIKMCDEKLKATSLREEKIVTDTDSGEVKQIKDTTKQVEPEL